MNRPCTLASLDHDHFEAGQTLERGGYLLDSGSHHRWGGHDCRRPPRKCALAVRIGPSGAVRWPGVLETATAGLVGNQTFFGVPHAAPPAVRFILD